MNKRQFLFVCISLLFVTATVSAQQDTFFLAKKKGLLGRLGRSISMSDSATAEPVKILNPYLRFEGLKINSIEVVGLGFEQNLTDTFKNRNDFFIKLANRLHKNTKESFIKRNLFFKEGDYLIPVLMADNETYLRNQPYLQDAIIIVFANFYDSKKVDVIVLTRDVFSLGGSINISSPKRGEIEVTEENLAGSGSKFSLSSFYDRDRVPVSGWAGTFTKRQIFNKFINTTAGFSTYKPAIYSGLNISHTFFGIIDKPLVHRFKKWTGQLEFRYDKTANNYNVDSFYRRNLQYDNFSADIWLGYNVGILNKKLLTLLHGYSCFVGGRVFYNAFQRLPLVFKDSFNYNFADVNGILFSFNIFKQNFYRTNFIYGFGRNEDVPEGINASLIAGRTNKNGDIRNYWGLNFEGNYLNHKGQFYAFTFRSGGYSIRHKWEDVDLLAGIDHFTALRKMGKNWKNRQFFGISYTQQLNHNLNNPLFLQSAYGLPYFRNGNIEANRRTTLKAESVFYNMKKILGFRFAPFAFTDFCLITPSNLPVKQSDGYLALGGGFRTRNENLIFGTIEMKGFFFPRTMPGMNNWKVDVTTNVRFKYNSTFIRPPDFIQVN